VVHRSSSRSARIVWARHCGTDTAQSDRYACPANWDVANQQICRPRGLRAPTIGEALVIMTRLGSGETWTDEVTHADGATQTRGLVTAPGDPQGQIFAAPVGSSHPVRCVLNATNPTS
jgi:hypothetical protein